MRITKEEFVGVRITKDMRKKLEAAAKREGLSLASLIVKRLQSDFNEDKALEKKIERALENFVKKGGGQVLLKYDPKKDLKL